MTMRAVFALTAALALAGCQPRMITPSPSIVAQEEIVVTGQAPIDVATEFPIRPDQIYPQVRQRALERALRDAQAQMLDALAAMPVSKEISLGDMMAQHGTVRLRALQFVESLPMEPPRWDWEAGEVEVDLRLLPGEAAHFVAMVPARYLRSTTPPPSAAADLNPPRQLPPPELEESGELPMLTEEEMPLAPARPQPVGWPTPETPATTGPEDLP